MKISAILLTVLGALFFAACGSVETSTPLPTSDALATKTPRPELTNPFLIQARSNYDKYCAHCHGWSGEGQIATSLDTSQRLGMHTVPPHNEDGHTWQHPDALLFLAIRDGIQNPLDHYPMPGFGDRLSDDEIRGLIAYMKLWWTPEQLASQVRINRNWQEANGG
jgi:hypothetical protein